MQYVADVVGLSVREASLAVVGFGLVVIGTFFAVMNWLCWLADIRLKKQKIDRHISMGPTFGICLALGCWLITPLSWHARWIWLLDPSALVLVISLPFLLQELVKHRR